MDIRCLAISEARFTSAVSHVLFLDFVNRGTSGRVDRHAALLTDRLRGLAAVSTLRVVIDSANLVAAWVDVKAALLRIYNELRRPVKVAVDLNSVPRFVALSLLGFGARTGIVETFTGTYAAASSYLLGSDGKSAGFTAGDWIPMSIPTLGEGASPSARSLLVVAAGFEGASTRRLVNALEPDRIAIVISTGIKPDHEQTARRANVGLAEDFLLEDDGVLWLPTENVAEGVAVLEEYLNSIKPSSEFEDTAVSFLLCGTKLSALTAAVLALDHPVAQVYYSDPERRLESTAENIEWTTAVEISL